MPERSKIIDVSERRAFRTIYEAINWCVGTEYTQWQQACWPSRRPSDNCFRLWFTQLAHIEHGRFVPSANNCLNLLCCNGNYHVFDDWRNHEPDVMRNSTWKYDLIFSKEVGGYYYFRGVFVDDIIHSSINHYVSKRIATKVRVIGCPARRLELLDSVPEVDFDKNYLKTQIISSDVVDIPEKTIPLVNSFTQPIQTVDSEKKKLEIKPTVDYEKMFPEGCRIRHTKFRNGTVKKVSDGIITVLFDNGVTKDLGADVCIERELIKKI